MYKSKLQELCHKNTWDLPVYTTVKDGPDHCPRFTTTVTVNGVPFESPKNQCKSSKEAQNVAAKLAYDYFSSSSNSTATATPALASSGSVASSNNVDVRPAKNDNLQQNLGMNVQNSPANETTLVHSDESRPKDLLHVYKNRLQHYMQKKNLALPEYSYEFDGPPHARLFKASVMVDGRTYRSPDYYPTLKDAEHAAAKVALESLSLGEVQEDEGLYKTLLQELAQKEGFVFPLYRIVKTGPSHVPTFISTVEVGGETYQGRECKTKKQSEMSAAKVAYNSLMERRTVNSLPPGCSIRESVEGYPFSLQSVIDDKRQSNVEAETTTESPVEFAVGGTGYMDGKYIVISPGRDEKEPLAVSSSISDSVIANDLQKNIQTNAVPTANENFGTAVKGEEADTKRYRISSPTENLHGFRRETSPPSSVGSDAPKSPEGNNPSAKILVFRRGSTMAIPEGACILPCSDDKWVAARVELNQSQQPQ